MKEIFISKSAKESIENLSVFYTKHRVECGGSLAAVKKNGAILVVHAVGAGALARQSLAHMVTDAEYQNKMLDKIRGNYKNEALDYAGDWHTHGQLGLRMLSNTDVTTIKRALSDPDYVSLGGEFIEILTTVDRDFKVQFHPFIMIKKGEEGFALSEVACSFVENDSKAVTDVLGEAIKEITEENTASNEGARLSLEELEKKYKDAFSDLERLSKDIRRTFHITLDGEGVYVSLFSSTAAVKNIILKFPAHENDGVVSFLLERNGKKKEVFSREIACDTHEIQKAVYDALSLISTQSESRKGKKANLCV